MATTPGGTGRRGATPLAGLLLAASALVATVPSGAAAGGVAALTATARGVRVTVPGGRLTARIGAAGRVPAFAAVAPLKTFTVTATAGGRAVSTFDRTVRVSLLTTDPDLAGADPAALRLARLAGTWSLLATRLGGDAVSAGIDSPGTYAVVALPAGTGVRAGHHAFAVLDPDHRAPPDYRAGDEPLYLTADGTAFRVRFRLDNPAAERAVVTPRLEYRPRTGGPFRPVTDRPDAAFHTEREWVAARGGTRPGAATTPIPVADLLVDDGSGGTATAGERASGTNPAAPVRLPGGGYSEVEFTVHTGSGIAWSSGYEFRLTDAGTSLAEAAVAQVGTGAAPAAALSAGQRDGTAVIVSKAAAPTRYALVTPLAAGDPAGGVHGPYSMTADQCAVCHRGHTGAATNLLRRAGSQSALCLTCHDGTGAPDVASQFTDPDIPADDPATRSYYGHDALAATSHTSATVDEFGGVANRHSECGDCHNAHRSGGPPAASTAGGWTPSGALAGISGVSVVNGAAGTEPAYTFLDGASTPVTLEYQLCLKCHSGATVLPSNEGFAPSRYELDKGVEFNPANPSYHPVEAAGTNQTAAMAASLSGTSPYKRWDFTTTSTVRCGNCHGGTAGPAAAPHRSADRGILTANYRDRVLKAAGEPYVAADFALCYLCHAESPFVAGGGTDATNFSYHALHVSGLAGAGSGGTDIDTAGAGQGNALCAECHYRIHSATYSVGGQRISGSRLVNFAPDVTDDGGTPSWTQDAATGGTCTLTCHGERHDGQRY